MIPVGATVVLSFGADDAMFEWSGAIGTITGYDRGVALVEGEGFTACADQSQMVTVTSRLEYLRGEIHAERISYSELADLQALAEYIEPGDVELLEWAGVSEFPDDSECEGHESLRGDSMGVTVYCDGSCAS